MIVEGGGEGLQCTAVPWAQTLRAAGVAQGDLPMLARDAMNVQRRLLNSPRDVGYADALAMVRAAF